MSQIQYTIRNIPPELDARLKAQAKKQGVSLNRLVLEKLGAPKPQSRKKVYHDLDWLKGALPPEETKLVDDAIKEAKAISRHLAYEKYLAENNQK